MKKLSLFLVALAMIMVSCKPEIEKPAVVTKSVGEVTETSAKVVGQVTADGGAEVTECGVCWNTEGGPQIIDFRVKDAEGGLGSFTSNLKDLTSDNLLRQSVRHQRGRHELRRGEELHYIGGDS